VETRVSVKVSCPRCGRTRKVRAKTLPHLVGKRFAWCVTCRLLYSRDQHSEAMRRIDEKVMARRLRGL
jgi:hypothetical protein